MSDIMNYAANLIFGSLPTSHPEQMTRQADSVLNNAVIVLRRRGHSVSPSDIPGLWNVSGYPELTTNQLVSIAFP